MDGKQEKNQEFCVRWNSHLGSIGEAFPHLLNCQRFVDVTLVCENTQLHCHRLVLAACSSFFESIFAENPTQHPVIILPRDVKLWQIQALIDFMYKGEVNVTKQGLTNLLTCAESLQIRGLVGSEAALNLNNSAESQRPLSNNKKSMENSTGSTSNLPKVEKLPENEPDADDSSSTSSHDDYGEKSTEDTCTKNAIIRDNKSSFSNISSMISNDCFQLNNKTRTEIPKNDSFLSMDESMDSNDESSVHLDKHSNYKRIRRSEALLTQAAKCVSKGQTFQNVSNMFNIPVSTIRFFMARKGILPKRKRGRSSGGSFGIIFKDN